MENFSFDHAVFVSESLSASSSSKVLISVSYIARDISWLLDSTQKLETSSMPFQEAAAARPRIILSHLASGRPITVGSKDCQLAARASRGHSQDGPLRIHQRRHCVRYKGAPPRVPAGASGCPRRFPLSQLVTARPERATSAAGRHNLSQKLLPAAAPTKSRMDGAPLTAGGSADRAARRKVSHCPPPLPPPPLPPPPSSARPEPFVRPGWKYPHCREPSR
ncbi:sterile alpha motif domain-containing protein 1-like [Schistocerca cancellata]|uniref:sterile alpha motif domain-containing protein 1-like n=1 Tax=Schistocerca cancellata TaxID=274614 RepID=UPI0021188EAB|nr:sterile alpha motif domain-containing protein 1-like [Schistocerca cancellata]